MMSPRKRDPKAGARKPARGPRRRLAKTGEHGIAIEPQPVAIERPVDEPHPHPPGHFFELVVQDARGRWVEMSPADIPPWRGETPGCAICGGTDHHTADCPEGDSHDHGADHDHGPSHGHSDTHDHQAGHEH